MKRLIRDMLISSALGSLERGWHQRGGTEGETESSQAGISSSSVLIIHHFSVFVAFPNW